MGHKANPRRKRCDRADRFTPSGVAAGAVGRALLIVHLVLSPLAFSRGTLDAFESNKVALLQLTALALAALGLSSLVASLARAGAGQRLATLWAAAGGLCRGPVVPGFLLFGLSAAVSTAASVSPRTSLLGAHESYAGLPTVAAALVLFLATRALFRTPADGRLLLGAAVAAAAVASAYAAVQAAGADPLTWDNLATWSDRTRPFSTLGHPNFLAAYLVMALAAALYLTASAARARRWWACAALAAVCLLAAAAVLTSLSRGAWLAGACMLPVLVFGSVRVGGRRAWACGAALLLAGALVSWAGLTGSLGGVTDRLSRLADGNGRWEIWDVAWRVFRDHPLCGCGLDTFHLAFGSRRTADCVCLGWDVTPGRAHNEVLHVLATQGLLGGTALLALAAGLLAAGCRAWRRLPPQERPLLGAVLAGLLAFAVQDLFSFTVAGCGTLFVTLAALLSRLEEFAAEPPPPAGSRLEAFALAVGAVLGLLVLLGNLLAEAPLTGGTVTTASLLALAGGASTFGVLRVVFPAAGASPVRTAPLDRPAPAGWGTRLPQAAVWAAAVAAAAVGVHRPYRAACACHRGDCLQAEAPRQALPHYERAVALAPEQDVYWFKLAAGAQVAAQAAPTGPEREGLLRRALRALERAAALVPANPAHHANLGRLLSQLAGAGLAPAGRVLPAFEAALALDPNNPCVLADAAQNGARPPPLGRGRPLPGPRPGARPAARPVLGRPGAAGPGPRPPGRGRALPGRGAAGRLARRRGGPLAGGGAAERCAPGAGAVRSGAGPGRGGARAAPRVGPAALHPGAGAGAAAPPGRGAGGVAATAPTPSLPAGLQ
jgi:O-antigen ligase